MPGVLSADVHVDPAQFHLAKLVVRHCLSSVKLAVICRDDVQALSNSPMAPAMLLPSATSQLGPRRGAG